MGKDLKGRELGRGIGQLKDRRYYARFTDRNGKRRKPYYSFSLKEVKDWLLKQKYEDKLGKTEIFHPDVTVGELYKLWYDNIKRKKEVTEQTLNRTRTKYNNHIKKYELYKVSGINKSFVESFMEEIINKELRLSYMTAIKSLFSQIINFGIENDICDTNPFVNYKFPKLIKEEDKKHKQEMKRTKFLTQEQQKIFLDYIDKATKCHYRDLYKFLLYTGLRISEAISLKWGHVNLDNRTVYVVDNHIKYSDEDGVMHELYNAPTKTLASNSILPLTNEGFEVLSKLKERSKKTNKKDLVFVNTKGNAVDYRSFHQTLREKVEAINKRLDEDSQLPNITPHFFRHTCAENLIESGVNLPAVQYMIRHAQLITTANTYGHTGYKIAKDAVEKLENSPQSNKSGKNKLPQNCHKRRYKLKKIG